MIITSRRFQFTRPRGARPRRRRAGEARCAGFNSRAREGRDARQERLNHSSLVSIHAPARGATGAADVLQALREVVSIHAPARGATGRSRTICPPRRFNSRAREGRDGRTRARASWPRAFQFTRPRGARPSGFTCGSTSAGFNSRAREGRDKYTSGMGAEAPSFQFTRPRGARPFGTPASRRRTSCFNSRAREGRDGWFQNRPARRSVSIHAPARGATQGNPLGTAAFKFQFTRPRGARLMRLTLSTPRTRFQFTRPRGARHPAAASTARPNSFNSRAREGRDTPPAGICPPRQVSIHAPARGATPAVRTVTSPWMFQFTRPRGARLVLAFYTRNDETVSIHAPARGATFRERDLAERAPRFNSRAREGRDRRDRGQRQTAQFQFTRPRGARLRREESISPRPWFQFTRPRGARLHSGQYRARRAPSFNSRAREGRDLSSPVPVT